MQILLDLPRLQDSQLNVGHIAHAGEEMIEVTRPSIGTVRLRIISTSTANDLVICQPFSSVTGDVQAALILAPYLYKGVEIFGVFDKEDK